jgi:hypothetical protein
MRITERIRVPTGCGAFYNTRLLYIDLPVSFFAKVYNVVVEGENIPKSKTATHYGQRGIFRVTGLGGGRREEHGALIRRLSRHD